jgi:hypothetical protein
MFDEILASFGAIKLLTPVSDRSVLERLAMNAARSGWVASGVAIGWNERARSLAQHYFANELTSDVLETHDEGGANWALFASFAVGWLLAMQAEGKLDADSADLEFARLPGYMWFNEQRICGIQES